MSVENLVLESNSKRERKENQFNALKRLVWEDIPRQLRKNKGKDEVILNRGTDKSISIFVSECIKEIESPFRMVYVKEQDLRRYTGAYIPELMRYFSTDELEIVDVTYQNIDEDERFFTLDFEDIKEGRLVMIRDTQFEYEEEMYDEYYFFLVDLNSNTAN